MTHNLTVTDLFAGAGGSSQGMHAVPGVSVRMAANHWQLAVDSHAANFPTTDHDCADISQVDPRRYPATDVLWASPECTNHSQAKGRKRNIDATPDLFGDALPDAAADRSRATMWDVPRFAEAMLNRGTPYRAVVVENVVEARDWLYFRPWLMAMEVAGYECQPVYLNSMFASVGGLPAPQSRDRVYFVFTRAGERRPDLAKWTRPSAWCARCESVVRSVQAWKNPDRPFGRYRQQYVWRCPTPRCHVEVFPGVLPAASAIDWTLAGQRIGDRDRPLAAKTIARIKAGIEKYGPTWLSVPVEGRDGKEPRTLDGPFRTMTCRNETGVALPPGFVMRNNLGGAEMCTPFTEPLRTLTTMGHQSVVTHPGMLVPTGGTWNDVPSDLAQPFRTRTTRDTEAVVIPPPAFIAELRGGGSTHRDVRDPLATVTASGNHHLLVSYYGNGGASDTMTEPVPTVTTRDRHALVSAPATLPDVDDFTLRMLEPKEIGAAMSFGEDYTVLGNKRERVRQYGNAVTPPAARDLMAAVSEAITGEPVTLGLAG